MDALYITERMQIDWMYMLDKYWYEWNTTYPYDFDFWTEWFFNITMKCL